MRGSGPEEARSLLGSRAWKAPGAVAAILRLLQRRAIRARYSPMADIRLVGFDGDDTLWRSEDYYRAAEKQYEDIVGRHIDLHDAGTLRHLLEVERRNLKVFGYGVKGMVLSMIEAAIELTDGRIGARDLHEVIEIGRATLQHPVELIEGIREAVAEIAAESPVVLITKGDLFHQEPQAYPCRVRASHRKSLKNISSVSSHCRRSRRACGPVRPVVAYSCPGFAPIMEAA